MWPFGRKKKRKSVADLMDPDLRERLRKDPFLYPVLSFFEGFISQDRDQMNEAAEAVTRCVACHREFVLKHGVKFTGDPESGDIRIECPHCGESAISLGYGPK